MPMPGLAQGYLDFVNDDLKRERARQEIASQQQLQQIRQMQIADEVRRQRDAGITGGMGNPMLPPMPGQASMPNQPQQLPQPQSAAQWQGNGQGWQPMPSGQQQPQTMGQGQGQLSTPPNPIDAFAQKQESDKQAFYLRLQDADRQMQAQGVSPEGRKTWINSYRNMFDAQQHQELQNANMLSEMRHREQQGANLTSFMKEAASLYGEGTPEYKSAVKKHIDRMDAPPKYMIGGGVGGSGGSSAGGSALDDTTLDYAAERYNATGQMPSFGFGKEGAAIKYKIMKRAAELSKGQGKTGVDAAIDAAGFKATQSALAQLDKQKNMVGAFERNFTKNADLALEVSDKVGRTGIPIINRWILAGKKNVAGDPDTAVFDQAIKAVVNEYAKIISGSMGNTALAEGEIKKQEDKLNSAQTPEQVKAVINFMKRETANRMKGFDEQRKDLVDSMKGSNRQNTAPQAAIDYLMKHPELKEDFRKKYGYLPSGI